MDSSSLAENPCPNCGETRYFWGIMTHGRFAKGAGLIEFMQQEDVAARLCENCGNVQLFLKTWVQDAIDQSKWGKRKRQG